MNIVRSDLIELMKLAMPGVESGNTILEGADTFIFKKGRLYTYNDHISVSVPLDKLGEESLEGAVRAKDFFDLVNRFKTDTLIFKMKEGNWIIKSGEAVAEFTLLESSIGEYIDKIQPTDDSWLKLPENFLEGAKISLFTNNRCSLSGLYVAENFIASTDEMRIYWYNMSGEVPTPFWISEVACKELLKLDSSIGRYMTKGNWVHFKSAGKGAKTVFSCKKLSDSDYPIKAIRRLVAASEKDKTVISGTFPSGLLEAIERASALSMNQESFDTIKLTFNSDHLEVFTKRPSGKYTEKLTWEKPLKSKEPISIYVDYAMVENGLRKCKGFYLKEIENNSNMSLKVILENENGIQIMSTFEGEK